MAGLFDSDDISIYPKRMPYDKPLYTRKQLERAKANASEAYKVTKKAYNSYVKSGKYKKDLKRLKKISLNIRKKLFNY